MALPLEVIEELVAEVEASQGTGKISVDLEACTVTSPSGKVTPFTLDPLRRETMLKGQDQIEQTKVVGECQQKGRPLERPVPSLGYHRVSTTQTTRMSSRVNVTSECPSAES